jgi:ATP-dependent Lhr-like helicase
MELAAIIRGLRAGALDQLEIPPQPLDVLMQQMVAACAAEPWHEDDLFALVTRAHPYRDLPRETFEELLCLLSDGIESSRGRFGAYIIRDRIHGRLQGRRGARSITVSNGGTIPDTAVVSVILQPDGHQIATLDEDFTIDSGVGDVIQLGNASWRISAIETAGRMYVEDAHGHPPTVPFWRGEAPQRTAELSRWVCQLREDIASRTTGLLPGYISQTDPSVAATVTWLKDECGVTDAGAEQLIAYIVAGRAVLGTVPTLTTIVAERFFDEGGGMQLILHAPFGGRINKAWGLALRKRFCRGFNFELQAAATDTASTSRSPNSIPFRWPMSSSSSPPTPSPSCWSRRRSPRPSSKRASAGTPPAVCNCCGFKKAKRSRRRSSAPAAKTCSPASSPRPPPASKTSKATSRFPVTHSSVKS